MRKVNAVVCLVDEQGPWKVRYLCESFEELGRHLDHFRSLGTQVVRVVLAGEDQWNEEEYLQYRLTHGSLTAEELPEELRGRWGLS